jgi:membrane dipeptidase
VITTNPFLDRRDRRERFFENLRSLEDLLGQHPRISLVRNLREYEAARSRGDHAAFIGVQGGNALDHSLDTLDGLADQRVLRVTLVHLSSSSIGSTSSPVGALNSSGLSSFGADYVRRLNELRVFVDLAHIEKRAFWDVVEVHDPSLPLLVSHTGIAGAHSHWRNLDDAQIRAVAKSGGTIGVMYHSQYLGDPLFAGKRESIVRHMEHIVELVGPEHVSLGSDWDGAIFTPRDMPTCLELPCLVDTMLCRGWRSDDIELAMGKNFLRVLRDLRG